MATMKNQRMWKTLWKTFNVCGKQCGKVTGDVDNKKHHLSMMFVDDAIMIYQRNFT